ncbi:MAG TPA: hypothetical protein VJ867_05540 [Gemmatimonadaceae bacterium]|nr:hypothetical protein [Gemmatimonadaceae bacterium]
MATRRPIAARIIAGAVIAAIAIVIVAQGFLPPDDALRHAAKAVSGRPWTDILILRPGTIDSSPGWHALLRGVHLLTGAGAAALVRFEVVALFIAVSLPALLLMRRVEAWIGALLLVGLYEPLLVARLVVGRPLLVSMTAVVTICLVWRRLADERIDRRSVAVVAALIAAATWIHGSWYLFGLPILAFVLARQPRAALRLTYATTIGVLLGALLSGMPVAFLWQSVRHAALALGDTQAIELVREFRPYPGNTMLVLAIGVIVIARRWWLGISARELLRDPVFMLAALGTVLGFRVARFYMDWGLPAVVAWTALELERLVVAGRGSQVAGPAIHDARPMTRDLLGTVVLHASTFALFALDFGHRWSQPPTDPAYTAMITPAHRAALPDSGGTLYADDMRAFYNLFFLEPAAPRRYMLGYEPGLMPAQDLAVYRNALLTRNISAFEPWARKLKPADRLVLHYSGGVPGLGLQWLYVGYGVWSGRSPR